MGVAVQQQVTSRISAEVQWNKRWFYGYYVSRNLAVDPAADWNDLQHHRAGRFAASGWRRLRDQRTARHRRRPSSDRRTTGSGGGQLRRRVPVLERRRPDRGDARQRRAHVPGRHEHRADGPGSVQRVEQLPDALRRRCRWPSASRAGLQAFGAPVGHGAGPVLPSGVGLPDAVPRPHAVPGAEGRRRGLGTYPEQAGRQLAGNYNVPSAIIAQSLGRAPSGGVANVTVNLITPGRSMATASTSSTCDSRRSSASVNAHEGLAGHV